MTDTTRPATAIYVKAWHSQGWHTRGFAIYDQHGHPYDWQDNSSGSSHPKGEYADVPTPCEEFTIGVREFDWMRKRHESAVAARRSRMEV
jgi:hypothetical protein